jgi:co-chaperonin GroES (HSP10)
MLQSTKNGLRQILVVGDRVLVRPDEPEERTQVGLFLPQTVIEKEKVQSGRIVSVGPGIPVPDPGVEEDEPWKPTARKHRYIPMQAQEGDYALFLKKSAIEIKFEGEDYLVVPQAAILLLLRDLEKKSPDKK